jgi:hypothetical protein
MDGLSCVESKRHPGIVVSVLPPLAMTELAIPFRDFCVVIEISFKIKGTIANLAFQMKKIIHFVVNPHDAIFMPGGFISPHLTDFQDLF